MRSNRSSPNPEEAGAGALDLSKIACSPLLFFRALSRRLLALEVLSSVLDSGSSFGIASEDVACDVAFIFSLLLFVLDSCKSVSSNRWQARHLTRTYFSGSGEILRLVCFLDPAFRLFAFDAALATLLVCDVHPGIKTVPHALHDELDSSLLLGLALPASSTCRWSINCAEVAGAVAAYRCPEACRNLSLASAAASAMMIMALSVR